MKEKIIKLVDYLEQIPSFMFVLWFAIFIYSSSSSSDFTLFEIHQKIFFTLIGFLLVGFFRIKRINIIFVLVFLILLLFMELNIFSILANWLFFKSPFIHLFDNLAAKDSNIISIATIILLCAAMLLLEIKNILLNKSYNLKRIFILITSGAVILTTGIFHYYVINHNFHNISMKIKEEMFNVFSVNQADIQTVCKYQKYTCIISNDIKDFKNFPDSILKIVQKNINNYIIASYPIENGKFINVAKKGNVWIFDSTRYNEGFKNASDIFLSLCIWAHSFWLIFLSFLLIFHNRKIRKLIRTNL